MFRSIVIGVAMLAVTGAAVESPSGTPALPELTVYKSPSCGCCQKWVEYLRANGFPVVTKDQDDLSGLKADLGVPKALASCHTAVLAGYVIEGHVPAEDIQRLLREHPKVLGLSAPGMPGAAPGMNTSKEPYQVLSFDARGRSEVWAKH